MVLQCQQVDEEVIAIGKSIKQMAGLEMTCVALACDNAARGYPFDQVLPLNFNAVQIASAMERASDLIT